MWGCCSHCCIIMIFPTFWADKASDVLCKIPSNFVMIVRIHPAVLGCLLSLASCVVDIKAQHLHSQKPCPILSSSNPPLKAIQHFCKFGHHMFLSHKLQVRMLQLCGSQDGKTVQFFLSLRCICDFIIQPDSFVIFFKVLKLVKYQMTI